MNQGKLEVVKQEMARVNIDILGISELKWSGMGEFNSDDYYIYYCGQESIRINGVAIIVSKRAQNEIPGLQSEKWQNHLCSFPRQTIQHHGNPSLCPNQYCWRSWSWMVVWRPTRPSWINTKKKRCSFHYRGLECKNRKSRDTWSNGEIWPWSTTLSRAKVNRFCQENALVVANTLFQQDSTHGHHQMVNTEIRLIIFLAANNGEALYSQQKQDRELAVAQIMNSLLPNLDLNWRK